jgi:hypothetical protein
MGLQSDSGLEESRSSIIGASQASGAHHWSRGNQGEQYPNVYQSAPIDEDENRRCRKDLPATPRVKSTSIRETKLV